MQRCRCFFNLLRRVNETEYFQITRQAPELSTGAILWLSLRRHIVSLECEREVCHADDCGLCMCPYPLRGHRRMTLHLYRCGKDGSKEKALDHSLYRLLHDEPNPEMTSFIFRETLMTHLLLWGCWRPLILTLLPLEEVVSSLYFF